jgi:hypothetical protein
VAGGKRGVEVTTGVRRYRDLMIWQKGIELAKMVYAQISKV